MGWKLTNEEIKDLKQNLAADGEHLGCSEVAQKV
jgi:hypothetical protein